MKWWHYLYLPEAQAAALGFTHSGRIFGVPAWLHEDDGYEFVVACPKVVPLQFYAMLMDALFEVLATLFMVDVDTPLSFTRRIGDGNVSL